jgi:hypothetical protein
LYGSITTADIADKLADAIGRDIDRRKLSLETPIKELGTHAVTLRLSSDITADFSVVVESDEQAAGAPTEDLESADAGGPVEALESIETPEPAAEEE